MALLQIAEVFGNDTSQSWDVEIRRKAWCPFRQSTCTKQGITDPLGICSYTDERRATCVCPVRFQEKGRLFIDVGRLAFGPGRKIIVAPEIRLLKVPGKKNKKIGKVDFLIASLDTEGKPADFAALEVQAVYISGKSIRSAFKKYLKTGILNEDSKRRPDFRSSAQKRLMPQLSLKVPIFRRWGKRFFVAVDAAFFEALPPLKTVMPDSAEITWMVYPFERARIGGFTMGQPAVHHTLWDDVLTSLREGEAPERSELLAELSMRASELAIYST
ncbi:MAG TPA: NotI family restriction endonuclease [Candidatus Methylacidiphilales bacterium]|nr:NotI family restriction endonuclease [Candidatus Methylacidiphilales bacterium]